MGPVGPVGPIGIAFGIAVGKRMGSCDGRPGAETCCGSGFETGEEGAETLKDRCDTVLVFVSFAKGSLAKVCITEAISPIFEA